tara:strand:- start:9158 stop:9388 length:231 start_codon:yes stop_codon:yes gene_type:complete
MSSLTDEQNDLLLELFDSTHDVMHMMRSMGEAMYEAASELEQCLLEAVKSLNKDGDLKPPAVPDNVISFPERVDDV